MATTREVLLRRADVPDEDIDDIIAIAARLQDEQQAAEDDLVSVAEVEAVAAELDIDPTWVEEAIVVLKTEREAAAAAQAFESARTRSRLTVVGLGLAGLMVMGAIGYGLTRVTQRAEVQATERRVEVASSEVRQAEAALATVLDRQASLVPQVAAAGGPTDRLQSAARQLRNAENIEDKLRASVLLEEALVTALAALPPATSDAEEQQRLSLQYEITGANNRIAVERKRWRQAKARAR